MKAARNETHASRAARFVGDEERARWHDGALWFVRERRDQAAARVPEWETLRQRAAAIKRHVLSDWATYLEQFEERAQSCGAVVHWASDAFEHNRIMLRLLRERRIERVVKSKSMLTEECGLNPFLERHGIAVVDSDLGERIVQLRNEPPSHIVLPAIHLRREDVGELFSEHLGTPPGLSDPEALTEAARQDLRGRFLAAQAGITGVNFAIAETGGIVVCTNEGNADLGTSIPPLHIASMGIEKLIPRAGDLGVFLRLLARSATGQAITAYTSHFHGPANRGELHIIIVDNGRSALAARPEQMDALACIRCGACLNTCPVFRRSGGHSYGAVIPGPIGSVIETARDPALHAGLPHACTLCGSCRDVCPVAIDLPSQLLAWRRQLVATGASDRTRDIAVGALGRLLASPRAYRAGGAFLRWALNWTPGWLERWIGTWLPTLRDRALPDAPGASFRARYARRRKTGIEHGSDATGGTRGPR